MSKSLSQKQRIIVGALYLLILSIIFKLIGGGFKDLIWNPGIDESILFYSGAFMIILGAYLVEPFFTKPANAIANATIVLIALLSLSDKNNLLGYSLICDYSIVVIGLGTASIFIKDIQSSIWKKISKTTYFFSTNLGQSKVIFSIVYISAAYSYFALPGRIFPFISILAFWICVIFFDVVAIIVQRVSNLISYLQNKIEDELGHAIGCDNPLLYKAEIDYKKHKVQAIKYGDMVGIETGVNIGSIGVIVNIKHLLNKRWLSIYFLQNQSGEVLKIDTRNKKLISDNNSIFSKENSVYLLDINQLNSEIRAQIENNSLYKNKEQFVGCVAKDSNITTINFSILRDFEKSDQKITEGTVLKTNIYGEDTLYQVINGNTREEHLQDFDKHGYTIGISRKLGKYDQNSRELQINKWMPSIYSPLFFAFSSRFSSGRIKEIAQNAVGRLPETDLEIPIKDVEALVTHNTAILGILGIGKSCLAFELIKRVVESGIKVICIDITNEYESELKSYNIEPVKLNDAQLKTNLLEKFSVINKDVQEGGNRGLFRTELKNLIQRFLGGEEQVLVVNPEDYDVSIQTSNIKAKKVGPGPNDWEDQAPMRELTPVEITRIISEIILDICKVSGRPQKTKCLIVYEEAHSLIPEWGSVASEGDKTATNGTAKVILQGRKYGFGSLIITQRTANVSKSILNQCNTIFALRVFDDTGKQFLENYIGKDYTNTLATLEERYAIAIGKGLKLKQPVIIQLNEKDHITISENPPINKL